MKINWKVRLKNPVFWVGIITTVTLTIFAQLGISAEDLTTWGALFDALLMAVKNPVVVVAVVTSVFNAVIDPTTAGICDSKDALTYQKPKGE